MASNLPTPSSNACPNNGSELSGSSRTRRGVGGRAENVAAEGRAMTIGTVCGNVSEARPIRRFRDPGCITMTFDPP